MDEHGNKTRSEIIVREIWELYEKHKIIIDSSYGEPAIFPADELDIGGVISRLMKNSNLDRLDETKED